jgi:hypothetical protein
MCCGVQTPVVQIFSVAIDFIMARAYSPATVDIPSAVNESKPMNRALQIESMIDGVPPSVLLYARAGDRS